MAFDSNSPILFVLVGLIIAAVVAQSVYFLVRALRRAKQLGIASATVKKTVKTAAIFTIAPAVAIVISVIALSKDLGIALPWLRLSVIGSMSYETVAASNAMGAMGLEFGSGAVLTAQQYVTIVWVMTVSILVGIWLAPLIGKRLQSGLKVLENRDKAWGDIFQNSLFIGMIAAFLGYVFCDVSTVFQGSFSGLIPVLTMVVSALLMAVSGIVMKKTGWRFMGDYALPISLVGGMAAAIPLTAWLG